MRYLLVIVLGVGSIGCASNPSVTEHQCRAGDWQTIGYRDGVAGVDKSRLLAHQEACGEFSIVPDRDAYLMGWNEGIPLFCTHANGYSAGERGATRNLVCDREASEGFGAGYEQGREIFIALSQVNAIRNQIAAGEGRLLVIEDEMLAVTSAQLEPSLTAQDRVALLADLKRLADEKARLQSELPYLVADLDEAQNKLERLRESHTLAYNDA